jgi:hypothetical protein
MYVTIALQPIPKLALLKPQTKPVLDIEPADDAT